MPSPLHLQVPLIVAFLAPAAAWLAGRAGPRMAHAVAVAGAAATFAALLQGHLAGGGAWDLRWIPAWNIELQLRLDRLGALYALIAAGIGTLVLVYSGGYIERHLREHGRDPGEAVKFDALLLLFLASMVGLALAQDLLLLFVFFDLTALVSYLLIGFDRDEQARGAALTALIVTAGSSVLFLAATAFVHLDQATLRIDRLELLPAGIAALVVLPALAKSAQAPLHFWLPRAMVAPTPVSAFLHSAAMVAAGVFVLSRLHPILPQAILDLLIVVGFVSIFVGGWIALTADPFKRLLAGSTIAQYGHVVVLLGLGQVEAASFYVLAHALAKSALFLTAGTITAATGAGTLSASGGLAWRLPLLAAASAVAAAALAGLPFTLGFFKDELFFGSLLERGIAFAALGLAATTITFAYAARFWCGIFLGPIAGGRVHAGVSAIAPIVFLGLALLAAGLDAGAASALTGVGTLGYHFDLRQENLLALATWAGGMLLYLRLLPRARPWLARALAFAGRYGPGACFDATLRALGSSARILRALEVEELRPRLGYTLVPTALLVGLAALAGGAPIYRVGPLALQDLPMLVGLAGACGGALAALLTRHDVPLVITLTAVGFTLAALFSFFHAPDVAVVAVLVETVFTILLLAFVRPLPDRDELVAEGTRVAWLARIASLLAAGFAFLVAWQTLSRPAPDTVATLHAEMAETAHGEDVVSVILADFRGLDTMGETTVFALCIAVVVSLVGRERGGAPTTGAQPMGPLVQGTARLLFLPALVLAIAFLIKGYASSGDGFGAGMVGATALAMILLAFGPARTERLLPLRAAAAIASLGLLLILLPGILPALAGAAPLLHLPLPGSPALHAGAVEFLSAQIFDAGIFLLVLGGVTRLLDASARLPRAFE